MKLRKIAALTLALTLMLSETNGMIFAADIEQEVEAVSDIDVENDYTETIEEADETEDDIEENIEMSPEEKQMASDGISEEDGEELFSDNENADDNLEKIVESGTITDTISWTLYDNGTLVISGTGDMPDYGSWMGSDDDMVPWYGETIKTITIEEGISSIGNYSFEELYDLESVELPESLHKIGDGAFKECSSLQRIDLKSVTILGSAVFYECKALSSINLSNKIENIETETFYDCSGLNSIKFPESLRYIGESAFYGCNISTVIIPYGVTEIEEGAFSECEKISVPYSVKRIGYNALGFPDKIYYAGSESEWDNIDGSDECYYYGTIQYYSELNHTHHRFSKWTVLKKTTIYSPEIQQRRCKICNDRETKNIGNKLSPSIKTNIEEISLKIQQKTDKFEVIKVSAGDSIVSWKSDNDKIVKVAGKKNGTCVITAGKKTGKTSIIITLKSGLVKKIPVKVQKGDIKTTKISGIRKTAELYKGQKITLKPILSPVCASQKINYTSSNKNVAVVNAKGVVSACGVGSTVITVKSGNKKVTCKVKVSYRRPDFGASLLGYNTRNNYFAVKFKNWGNRSLYIIPGDNKVEHYAYKTFDRYLRMSNGKTIVVKPGKTAIIKFYVQGDLTWYDHSEYSLFYTFSYDGKKYKGRTQCVGSAYKHGKKWKNTYSTSNEDNYIGIIGE